MTTEKIWLRKPRYDSYRNDWHKHINEDLFFAINAKTRNHGFVLLNHIL